MRKKQAAQGCGEEGHQPQSSLFPCYGPRFSADREGAVEAAVRGPLTCVQAVGEWCLWQAAALAGEAWVLPGVSHSQHMNTHSGWYHKRPCASQPCLTTVQRGPEPVGDKFRATDTSDALTCAKELAEASFRGHLT